MKTNFIKITIPIIAILIATIIAITLQSSIKKNTVLQGYLVGEIPCSLGITCSDVTGQVCTIKINDTLRQAFGKASPFPTDCTKVLYKP